MLSWGPKGATHYSKDESEGNSLAAQRTSKEVNLALGRAMKEFKTNK